MAKHYKQNKKDGKSDSLMMPKDAADNQHGHMSEQTQMYHMGKGYYGPGYGHPSNLPPYPDMKLYPKKRRYLRTGDYPDTMREIDDDAESNIGNLNSQPSNSMY